MKVYVSETKNPLEQVVLSIKDSINCKSHNKEILLVERKKDFLGNIHQIAFRDPVFILSKKKL